MREKDVRTEIGRLKSLRDSLLDRAEAQLKEGKLPHTEIGLVHKLERVILQNEKRMDEMALTIAQHTIKHFGKYLLEHDLKIASQVV